MTIAEKIQEWCDSSISKLTSEYESQNRKASGQWSKDLESKITQTNTGYNVQLLGSYYTYWMEKGRKPGKFPPIDVIRRWIDEKGIIAEDISRDSLTFLIARKIAKQGYQGKPLVENVLTEQWIKELFESVGLFMAVQIKEDIIKQFKAA